mmetsp:Transcript_22018/g.34568  ORF Transcript_22018/g.34568 Transcript_22018/m.34568 type:complete len:236 (+) Transcript_22018:2703-3410(+)
MTAKLALVLGFPLVVLHRPRQNHLLVDSTLVEIHLLLLLRKLIVMLVGVMIRRVTRRREVVDLASGPPLHLHPRHRHRRRMLLLVLPTILLHLVVMKTKVTLPTLEHSNLVHPQATRSQKEDVVKTKRTGSKVAERRKQVLALGFRLVPMRQKTSQLQQHLLGLGRQPKKRMRRRHWLPHLHLEVHHLRRKLTTRQVRLHLDPLLPMRKRKVTQHQRARQASLSANHLRVREPLQ